MYYAGSIIYKTLVNINNKLNKISKYLHVIIYLLIKKLIHLFMLK